MALTPSIWTNPHVSSIHKESDTNSELSPQSFHKQLPSYESSPLTSLADLAESLHVKSILLKDESNRLSLPSFKILGASWGCYRALVARLGLQIGISIAELRTKLHCGEVTLFAATDGNHGRAIAHMAGLLGIKAKIIVSDALDEYTKNAISSSGGTVIPIPAAYDRVVQEAQDQASATNGLLVQDTAWPGYEEIPGWIVDGYSTIFLELDEQCSKLTSNDIVIVPVGVGSLAHAAVLHWKSRPDGPRIVAVEPEMASCLHQSLRSDERKSIQTGFTIMTGMNCGTVSYTAWNDLRRGIDISVTVTENQAHKAVQDLQERSVNAGPCGAACLAAVRLLVDQQLLAANSVVVVINTEGQRPYDSPA